MRKFDPDKELAKIQNNQKSNFNTSKLSNMFVPLLVIGCCLLSIVAITFSATLANDKDLYKVRVDVIGQDDTTFTRNVSSGAFRAILTEANTPGNLTCSSGSLNYDPNTGAISSPYLNQDTTCILSLTPNVLNNLSIESLLSINDNEGISYYFKGDATNNYIIVNNMLFRIVRINGDGSLRIVLSDVILSSNYGDFNNYNDSNLKNVLDEWFIANFNKEPYITNSAYDYTNYETYDLNDLINLEGYFYGPVGTLSVKEVALITKDLPNSYLDTMKGFVLMNGNGADNVWAYQNNQIVSVSSYDVLSVRPVININVTKLSGSGTQYNPYKIEE